MLKTENVSLDVFQACILSDSSGKTLAAVMDRFGYYLATHEDDFLTCPLHALAVALVMQEAPCVSLLSQLPLLAAPATTSLNAGEPLLEMLEAARSKTTLAASSLVSKSTASPSPTTTALAAPVLRSPSPYAARLQNTSQARGEDGVQAYRRCTAPHANGDERLAAQWIFDRGSWDMTRTNKGFAYVFNTPREDRKVARVLSGWKADEAPTVADQDLLFGSCIGMEHARLNYSRKVIGVLTAYLIKYLPQVRALAPTGLFVVRVEECLDAAGIIVTDVLAWSSILNHVASMPVHESKVEEERTNHCKSGCHHEAVINELIESNRLMAARLLVLEAVVLKRPAPHESAREEAKEQEESVQEQPVKRRKKAATNLFSIWFEWYTRMPRIWDSSNRQKKSDYRLVVVYMKLLLDDGFLLHEGAEDFKDRVLEIGLRAESAVLSFLSGHGIRAKGGSSVLREMGKLHRVGKLNGRILAYRSRLAVEKIVDPAPVGTQNILQIENTYKKS
ncbi:hypothetical protein PHMEG_00029443 [Phytophthora megakarya]|uniref:Uncharacterized protein n=1 Tax=Phytophthora megakarya TaxID=4795 RepID=A0A225V572_9STRA|nr:hypothetical protein PHMEG_00029443 [Phytophthora megakarya]